MKRVSLLFAAVGAVSFAGCWNFDSAYGQWCSKNPCDGGTGGAVDGGGGAGGSTGGTGGSTGGAGGGAARICHDTLCFVAASRSLGIYGVVGAGADSLATFRGVGTNYSPVPDVPYEATPDGDGGLTLVGLTGLSTNPYQAEGRSTGEVFIATGNEVAKLTNAGLLNLLTDTCGTATGTSFYGISVPTAGIAYALGSGGVICKLENDTPTLVANWGLSSSVYPYSLYQSPTGFIYVVGSDGVVHDLDGGTLSGLLDPDATYGLMAVGGTSDSNVWTVGYSGGVSRINGSGGFDVVFDAGTDLHDLLVRSESDVWVAGRGAKLWHWDGAAWTTWPVVGLELSSVTEKLLPVPGGFHMMGAQNTYQGPDRAFVITYAFNDAGY